MIPIDGIVPDNLYSQGDAVLLLGEGFSPEAAREVICEVCRSGELPHKRWRKRYWFTGRDFLDWVGGWFGENLGPPAEGHAGSPLAHEAPVRHNTRADSEPARRPGREVSE